MSMGPPPGAAEVVLREEAGAQPLSCRRDQHITEGPMKTRGTPRT